MLGLRQQQPGKLARSFPSRRNLQCKSINSVRPVQQHCRPAWLWAVGVEMISFHPEWPSLSVRCLCHLTALALIRRGSPEQAVWWKTGAPANQLISIREKEEVVNHNLFFLKVFRNNRQCDQCWMWYSQPVTGRLPLLHFWWWPKNRWKHFYVN